MAEEIARSLEGSDLKWMREAAEVMHRTRDKGHRTITVHYAIPDAEYRSLVKLGLVRGGTLVLTKTGEAVARILNGDGSIDAQREQD